jgi:hypothetical protein
MNDTRILRPPDFTSANWQWREFVYDPFEDDHSTMRCVDIVEVPPERLMEVATQHQDSEKARRWLAQQYDEALAAYDVERLKLFAWLIERTREG